MGAFPAAPLFPKPRDHGPLGAVTGATEFPKPLRRVAVLGGIYSNHLALGQALAAARARKVEAIFCLGDLGGFGPHPDITCELLRRHEVQVMRGNYDDAVARGLDDCGCGYADPRDIRFARLSYDYTRSRTSEDNRRWMASLPVGFRFRLGRTPVLTCHGSPRELNEFLWESGTPDGLLRMFLDASGADLILATHSGLKWVRRFDDGRGFVNVGVLGRPENDGTPRVWFTLLEAEGARGWKAEFVPVDYDHEALAREMREEGLPEEFVETILTGWWTTCLEILPAKERLSGKY